MTGPAGSVEQVIDTGPDDAVLADRIDRVRARLDDTGVDAVLLSVGADLPYLTGYRAMPLERLTMLVVDRGGLPTLVVPGLEAARVRQRPEVFELVTWAETEDPIALVDRRLGGARRAAIGDQTWAGFAVDLLARRPGLELSRASAVISPLRSVKDDAEVAALAAAAAAADRVQQQLRDGEIALVGRTEAAVAAEVSRALLEAGHDEVNFAIVAAGPNAASPHHHPGPHVIESGQSVLFDIGGTLDGYCSDITRNVFCGDPPPGFVELHDALEAAQRAAVAAATVGTPAQEIDRVARRTLEASDLARHFIHRTGHGIGLEAHEDPYIVEGNDDALAAGHAFSVEPGVYVPGRWGARIEDIVVATPDGPRALNLVDHGLAVLA